MPKTRRVYVVTSTAEKLPEYSKALGRYGIEVILANPYGFPIRTGGPAALLPLVRRLLAESDEATWTKAVMYEQTRLLRWGTEDADAKGRKLLHGERVTVSSQLTVWSLPAAAQASCRDGQGLGAIATSSVGHGLAGGACKRRKLPKGWTDAQRLAESAAGEAVDTFVYRHEAAAYIDLSKRQGAAKDPAVFNWDDIVVDFFTGLSYHEKKVMGCKVSPREMMLSEYLRDHIHYRARKVCKWHPVVMTRAVDFGDGGLAARFVLGNSMLTNECAQKSGISKAFASVVRSGLFLRAPMTRRELNYWLPGLNAGLPLVPKRDPVHEVTFQAHDLGHFLIPDLLYTGRGGALHRRLYIVHRMLSEALTIVFADMLFAETLRRSGVEYDFHQRRIWPLFRDTGLDPFAAGPEHMVCVMKTLMHASVAYCLLGDDSRYQRLLAANLGECEARASSSLVDFESKYMPFFVEDYHWTAGNYADMASRADEMRRWWDLAEPIRRSGGLEGGCSAGLQTVEEFAGVLSEGGRDLDALGGEELVWAAFEEVFEHRIAPVFLSGDIDLVGDAAPPAAGTPSVELRSAFGRYMMGQCAVLARFHFVPESLALQAAIHGYFARAGACPDSVTPGSILELRSRYEDFLGLLVRQQLLSSDDAATFAEVCPLFEPRFASYDELSRYTQLAQVCEDILGVPGKHPNAFAAPAPAPGRAWAETGSMRQLHCQAGQAPHSRRADLLNKRRSCALPRASKSYRRRGQPISYT